MIGRALCICCVLVAGSAAWAVQPETWEHKTEADFAAGEFNKTALTSLGEVMLARAAETIVPPNEELGMISAMAVDAKGRLYLAAAPGATVYRLAKKKLVQIAELPGVLVRVLRFVDGKLLAGTSGNKAGVYRIDDDGKVTPVWTDKQATLVWEVLPGPKKSLYVATGPEGKLYHVTDPAKGKAAVIYDSEDDNILSLAAAADGRLYAGTGENGLIIEIDPATKASRIIYDADEPEIWRILLAEDGVVYAATSDPTKAGDDGEAPSDQEKGAPASAPATQPAKPATTDLQDKPGKGASPADAASNPGPGRPAYMSLNEIIRMTSEGQVIEPFDPTIRLAAGPAEPRPANGMPGPLFRFGAKLFGGPVKPEPAAPPEGEEAQGNAVYRIDKAGFVRAVFRRPVTILDMVLHKGTLVLATGHGGQVFSVDLASDRTSMLAKLDPKDITALCPDADGKLYVGTADKAAVYILADELAKKGEFLSSAFDAGQIAAWGTLRVRAKIPPGCSGTIATRSGNVEKPDEKTWSDFSGEMRVGDGWAHMTSRPGRFLQYRLTLTGTSEVSASVNHVQLVYQVKNLAPVVRAVEVAPSVDPEAEQRPGDHRMTHRIVKIQAEDPNGDDLHYAVYFRKAGGKRWIQLVEKFSESEYAWNITTVPDGTYEVRVEACDAPANPRESALTAGRVSRAVVVDNAAPRVTLLKPKAGKGASVKLSGTIADQTSRIVKIEYAVDGVKEWLDALPADGICDSQNESFSAVIADLAAGIHHLAVKAIDEYGNAGYASLEVTVGK